MIAVLCSVCRRSILLETYEGARMDEVVPQHRGRPSSRTGRPAQDTCTGSGQPIDTTALRTLKPSQAVRRAPRRFR